MTGRVSLPAVGTRQALHRLRTALLVATAAALAGSLLAINAARADADSIRSGVAPAREGLAAARQSLVEANTEAMDGFTPEQGATVAGPGEAYQSAVAAAGRHLALVAEADLGESTGQGVQVVESLLITYLGLMEQARAYFYADEQSPLAKAYLQYAYLLLDKEILPQLASLRADVEAAAPAKPGWGRHALWIGTVLILLALLIATQVFLARRFRRTLSAPLVVATLLVLALGTAAQLSLRVDAMVATGQRNLSSLVQDYQSKETAMVARGCEDLKKLSTQWYGRSTEACPREQSTVSDRDLLRRAGTVSSTTQQAAATADVAMVAAAVLAALAALLIALGLQPRIDEYRYRSR